MATLTMAILTMADHGELANTAACAQAGVHQPDEEDAGLLVSSILGAREVAAKADSMQTAMTFSLVVLQIARLQLQVYTVQRERERERERGF